MAARACPSSGSAITPRGSQRKNDTGCQRTGCSPGTEWRVHWKVSIASGSTPAVRYTMRKTARLRAQPAASVACSSSRKAMAKRVAREVDGELTRAERERRARRSEERRVGKERRREGGQ